MQPSRSNLYNPTRVHNPASPPLPTSRDVEAAHARIHPWIRRTPVLTCASLDRLAGATLFLKCEMFQRTGSFKYRGATNAVRSLSDREAARGVATHSSGNFAQALALAARERGIAAHIVMPRDSAPSKREAVAAFGGHITECEPTLEAREETLRRVVDATGATFLHPYDNAAVIAGQGTACAELLDEIPNLDAIVAPIGGGGLMSGTALAARSARPGIHLSGAEPELADDAFRSLRDGKRLPARPPITIADGLRTSLGELTFPILRDCGVQVALATEDEIIWAMRLLWMRAKIVVEPSGATALAVLLRSDSPLRGARVGVILSGGNVETPSPASSPG